MDEPPDWDANLRNKQPWEEIERVSLGKRECTIFDREIRDVNYNDNKIVRSERESDYDNETHAF